MTLKFISFIIGFILIFAGFVYIHEVTHQQINDIYGLDSKIAFLSKECSAEALACNYVTGNQTISKEEEISLNQTQSINEIVGYSLGILYYIVSYFGR